MEEMLVKLSLYLTKKYINFKRWRANIHDGRTVALYNDKYKEYRFGKIYSEWGEPFDGNIPLRTYVKFNHMPDVEVNYTLDKLIFMRNTYEWVINQVLDKMLKEQSDGKSI